MERAKFYRENREWLEMAATIASQVADLMRIHNNMTQSQLADQLGVSQPYVSKLLKGEQNVCLETKAKINKIFDVRLADYIENIEKRKFTQIPTIPMYINQGTYEASIYVTDIPNVGYWLGNDASPERVRERFHPTRPSISIQDRNSGYEYRFNG